MSSLLTGFFPSSASFLVGSDDSAGISKMGVPSGDIGIEVFWGASSSAINNGGG